MLKVPNQFFIHRRIKWFSMKESYDVETSQSKLGVLHRRWMLPEYDFYDSQGQLQAKAKGRFWGLGTNFDIMDAEGKLLGFVRKPLFSRRGRIFSATGEILAVADLNFWATTYSLQDPVTSAEMAQLSSSWTPYQYHYSSFTMINQKVFQNNKIHPYFLIFFMVFPPIAFISRR